MHEMLSRMHRLYFFQNTKKKSNIQTDILMYYIYIIIIYILYLFYYLEILEIL